MLAGGCGPPTAAPGGTSGTAPSVRHGPKVLRLPMRTDGPKSLDPVRGSTVYDNRAISQIYQPLLQYKYLVRPFALEPLLLEAMPQTDDGRTYHFRLKRGIHFHDDPCFPGGKGRALTARDVFYSWKRMADDSNLPKSWWLFENTIVGFDDYRRRQNAADRFDYDVPVEGLKIEDDATFTVTLTEPVQRFLWVLAMFQTAVVPREAVEKYGDRFGRHPVGTGPFTLDEREWIPGQSMIFRRNKNYHEDDYPDESMPEDRANGLLEAAGRRLPRVDRVEIRMFVQDQPMWLQFRNRKIDYVQVPAEYFSEAFVRRARRRTTGPKNTPRTAAGREMPGRGGAFRSAGSAPTVYTVATKQDVPTSARGPRMPRRTLLKRSYRREGITARAVPLLDFIFRGFNMEDPLLGGYADRKKWLRQAISLALDWQEQNDAFYNGMNIIYDGPIPPGLDGYPPDGHAPISYRGPDLPRARRLLAKAGYPGGEGLPTIEFYTSRGGNSAEQVEMLTRQLARIGVRINPRLVDFSTLIEAINHKKAPFYSFAWGSDYPDAENNLALFYGPNESPGSNHFNYRRPAYDTLYETIRVMPPSPRRTALYGKMRDMVIEDAPFAGSMARTRYYLINPRLKNFKPAETFYNWIKYLDVGDMGTVPRGTR